MGPGAYTGAGQKDKALEIEKKLKLREEKEPGVLLHMDYAFLYTGMKEFDLAFQYLNKTYDQRIGISFLCMIFCIRYPMLKELKSDPRFKQLINKMGLKE